MGKKNKQTQSAASKSKKGDGDGNKKPSGMESSLPTGRAEGAGRGRRRAKGHRQKGAGTVAVDKGPREHAATGVTVQSWQRLPSQLLNEYAQRQKKPKPYYHPVNSAKGFRQRVKLADGKNANKDLAFATEQSFESMAQAKEHTALLALHSLQPSLPLERKLPDPYKSIWIETVAAAKAASSSNARAEKKAPAKKSNPAPKPTETLEVAKPKNAPPTSTGNGMEGIWANTTPDPENSDSSSSSQKVFALTSDRKFASKKEANVHSQARRARQNAFKAKREARERANMDTPVDMTRRMRRVLEDALGLRDGIENDELDSEEAEIQMEALGGMGQKQVNAVVDRGFTLAQAIRAWLAMEDELDLGHEEEELTNDSESEAGSEMGNGNSTVVSKAANQMIEWLCLNLKEEDLPEGFDPASGTLDVVAPTGGQHGPNVRTLRQTYGFRADESLAALTISDSEFPKYSASQRLEHALILLHAALQNHLGGNRSKDGGNIDAIDETEDALEDEMMALEAIFEDHLKKDTTALGDALLTFDIGAQLEGSQLELRFLTSQKYPVNPPLVLISGGGLTAGKSLICLQQELNRHCLTLVGQPMIYDIILWAQSTLPELLADLSALAPVPLLLAPVQGEMKQTKVNALDRGPLQAKKKKAKRFENSKDRKIGNVVQDTGFWGSARQDSGCFDPSSPAYKAMQKQRSSLPAANAKAEFLTLINNNQVVLVSGETGCGKTTQIPQFLLEDADDKGAVCKVVVAQPRRIAAVGVATRVAEEMGEKVGGTSGYMIRGESRSSGATRILFCTTGILLRRLQQDRSLANVTHLVVDEVHERHLEADFLLALLRTILPARRGLKVILMSATLESERFAAYLADVATLARRATLCPVLTIPGRTFPVQEFFLEDIFEITQYMPPQPRGKQREKDFQTDSNGNAQEDLSEHVQEALGRIDLNRMDSGVAVELVMNLVTSDLRGEGSILVFMSGVGEISAFCRSLSQRDQESLWVLPLHGSLTSQQQQLVFQRPPHGKTKVVVSTNVAETSITIPDVTVVIDSGRVKQMVYDPTKHMPCLVEGWAAKDSMTQRKGRAGRVQSGVCFRLLTRSKWCRLPNQTEPEMQRVPLDQLLLQVLSLDIGDATQILTSTIDPPSMPAISAAYDMLSKVGALASKSKLTALGHHLAALPCAAKVAKMLIYGAVLGCLDPILSIAAGLSTRSPFLKPRTDEEKALFNDAKVKFSTSTGGKSDHCALAAAYEGWAASKKSRQFCDLHGLSWQRMQEISQIRSQLGDAIKALGFRDGVDTRSSSWRIVKSAICAGLYPSAVQVFRPSQKYYESAQGSIATHSHAKEMRYFTKQCRTDALESKTDAAMLIHDKERVFIHPSSVNFSQAAYSCPWLVYNEKVNTSKVYICDSTEVSPYALMMFGGEITVDAVKGVIMVDEWIRFSAVGRIAALMKALRKQFDILLMKKIQNPELNISESKQVNAAVEVILSSGLGT